MQSGMGASVFKNLQLYRIRGGDGGGFITLHTHTHARNTHYTSALSPDAHKIIILVENKHTSTYMLYMNERRVWHGVFGLGLSK